MEIYFAPLQGYTDRVYRQVHYEIIGGVDAYYTPYLSIDKGKVKVKDVAISNNSIVDYTIPQLLPANLNELKLLVKVIAPFSYKKINLNLGCPYPMVTRKGRGAALMQKPEVVREMMNYLADFTAYNFSLKVRSGLENHEELALLIDQIPVRCVSEIIVHPRTAKQLYNGVASLDAYRSVVEKYPAVRFIYNGDILSLNDYNNKFAFLPNQQQWMIGRGLLENPFLAVQLKSQSVTTNMENEKTLQHFIYKLIAAIEHDCYDTGQALNRIKIHLNLLLGKNEEKKGLLRKIKKIKVLDDLKVILFEKNEISD